jgi:hypothetical protein
VLRKALDAAKLGRTRQARRHGRLDAFTRGIETAPRIRTADVDAANRRSERADPRSPRWAGRTVFDDQEPSRRRPARRAWTRRLTQLPLFPK